MAEMLMIPDEWYTRTWRTTKYVVFDVIEFDTVVGYELVEGSYVDGNCDYEVTEWTYYYD
jgi:hypothetical protein